jgi:hypothetical protein
MALSEADRAELNRLTIENVRLKMAYAGADPGSVVPGLGKRPDQPFGMTRADVELWLAEQANKTAEQQASTLWWAVVAGVSGIIGILVAVLVAIFGK